MDFQILYEHIVVLESIPPISIFMKMVIFTRGDVKSLILSSCTQLITNIISWSLNFYLETKNNEISDAAVVHGVRNLGSQFRRSLVRECCRLNHGGRLVFGKVTSITQRPPPMCTFPRVNITYSVSRNLKFLRRNTN